MAKIDKFVKLVKTITPTSLRAGSAA